MSIFAYCYRFESNIKVKVDVVSEMEGVSKLLIQKSQMDNFGSFYHALAAEKPMAASDHLSKLSSIMDNQSKKQTPVLLSTRDSLLEGNIIALYHMPVKMKNRILTDVVLSTVMCLHKQILDSRRLTGVNVTMRIMKFRLQITFC